jgi:hypothetical protein
VGYVSSCPLWEKEGTGGGAIVLGRLGCGTASAKLLLPVGPCTLHWC